MSYPSYKKESTGKASLSIKGTPFESVVNHMTDEEREEGFLFFRI